MVECKSLSKSQWVNRNKNINQNVKNIKAMAVTEINLIKLFSISRISINIGKIKQINTNSKILLWQN